LLSFVLFVLFQLVSCSEKTFFRYNELREGPSLRDDDVELDVGVWREGPTRFVVER
jgi:hypothetical protein